MITCLLDTRIFICPILISRTFRTVLVFCAIAQITHRTQSLPQLPLLNLFSGDLGKFLVGVGNSLYGPKIVDPQDDREIEEYDFVIIGAGPAGCILANRLTESPDWKVLLLEAGNAENPISAVPQIEQALQLTEYNKKYQTVPQDNGCLGMIDNKCNLANGKGLGGSSAIGNNIYSRGFKQDYDLWSQEINSEDWTYENILQYHKRAEDVHLDVFDWDYHGLGGPSQVEDLKNPSRLRQPILSAAKELNYSVADYNGKDQTGFSRPQTLTKRGRRHSTSKAYLESIKDRKNLFVKTLSNVTRILINPETMEAEGVEYVRNGRKLLARNKKDVILSAGAINSPQLLMLSGIGPKDHLEEVGVKCLEDLPVGENLKDHPIFLGLTYVFDYKKWVEENYLLDFYDWLVKGRGPLTTCGLDAFGRISSGLSEDPEYPDIEIGVIPIDLSEGYDLIGQLTNFKREIYDSIWKDIEDEDIFILGVTLIRPKSSGSVRLRSKDIADHPIVDPKYFSEGVDVEIILEGIKKVLELADTDSFKRIDANIQDASTYGCKEYNFGSDQYWKCAIPRLQMSTFHYTGTNKMGKVVDERLRVKGVINLRVVDASVIPVATTGHTLAPVMMLGEKASDIIKDDWNYI